MIPVEANPGLPNPPQSVGDLPPYLSTFVARLTTYLTTLAIRVNESIPKDGSELPTAGTGVATYLTADRPSGLTAPTIIFVSDAAAGSRFQGWDTTDSAWKPLG